MVAPAGLLSNRYEVKDMPDLNGKVAIVTGGSRGIGEAAVSALVQKGCEGKCSVESMGSVKLRHTLQRHLLIKPVHILSATREHAETAISNISKIAPDAPSLIHFHQIDLGNLRSVVSTSQQLAKTLPRIDMLYLIAGIGVAPFGLTSDGLGNHFAINHLAGMAVVANVLEKMKETAGQKAKSGNEIEKFSSRIVMESSELHRASPSDVKCESVEEMNHDMDETKLYGRSKLLM
jgi:WW domain-containing oxidoreductase